MTTATVNHISEFPLHLLATLKKKTVDLSVKVNLIVYYYVLVRFQLRVYILQLNVFFFQLNSYSE